MEKKGAEPEASDTTHDSLEIRSDEGSSTEYHHTKRRLKPRHIQLLGIGGTIGTVLVSLSLTLEPVLSLDLLYPKP